MCVIVVVVVFNNVAFSTQGTHFVYSVNLKLENSLLFRDLHVPADKILGDFRFEYEYEIEYENDSSVLVCRLHIVTSHNYLIP